MNNIIGSKETSAALTITSLTPVVLFLTKRNGELLGNASWINCLILVGISLAFLPLYKFYFKTFGTQNIVEAVKSEYGKICSVAVAFVSTMGVISVASMSFGEYSETLNILTAFKFGRDNISLFLIIVCAICSYSGLESLTRQSYVTFAIVIVLMCILSLITVEGWNYDNLLPVFGSDIKNTLTDGLGLSVNIGLLPLFLINNKFRNSVYAYRCIRRWLILTAITSFFVFLLYSLTVPYPVAKDFDVPLEAVFSSAGSGEVMHRFEIFLLSLYAFCSVVCVSFFIAVTSYFLSSLFTGGDVRIYTSVISLLIYLASFIKTDIRIYPIVCVASSLLPIILILFLTLRNELKKRNTVSGGVHEN